MKAKDLADKLLENPDAEVYGIYDDFCGDNYYEVKSAKPVGNIIILE